MRISMIFFTIIIERKHKTDEEIIFQYKQQKQIKKIMEQNRNKQLDNYLINRF
ncbi:YrzI family small protein [Brevibacillus daliensis]|uniref:YrzI family small protein n=1 Tax=Brevibacillus daliensis TaxID=2892995 RepID=UPI001E497FC8|nr:YrzI family small protein [Brevibacillus daliensis]